MKVKLIGYTQPTEEVRSEGMENVQDLISFCARVSNPSNQMNTETTDKLLKYLLKHKHFSPFEMAHVTIEIETTRDIARQILRHRSFSFQEFSQRYANPQDMKDAFEIREARLQDPVNRQNSIECTDAGTSAWWDAQQKHVIQTIKKVYDEALERGIAKEQARAVLPEGLTKSRMYMAGSIRSWIHYIELRAANGTQQEHSDIAIEIAKVISEIFPFGTQYIRSNNEK